MALTNQVPSGTNYVAAFANQHSIPIVTSLPTDITLPLLNKLVYNTTDGMIYRYDGANWVAVAATGGGTAATVHESRYEQTTLQNVVNATDTKLIFNSAPAVSAADVTGTGSFTDFLINRAGVWIIEAGVKYALNAGGGERHIWIQQGTTFVVGSRKAQQTLANVAALPATLSVSTVLRVSAATSFCIGTFQNCGATLATDVGFGGINHVSLTWLRPL
jgi:hypothetical protein